MKSKREIMKHAAKHFRAEHCQAAFYKGYREAAESIADLEADYEALCVRYADEEVQREIFGRFLKPDFFRWCWVRVMSFFQHSRTSFTVYRAGRGWRVSRTAQIYKLGDVEYFVRWI